MTDDLACAKGIVAALLIQTFIFIIIYAIVH